MPLVSVETPSELKSEKLPKEKTVSVYQESNPIALNPKTAMSLLVQ